MDHTPFILGAYAVAFLALGALTLLSWARMRRAEREED
ncbi:MAG: heme exporter protein CcmD [Sphingomonadaceae bacterium]